MIKTTTSNKNRYIFITGECYSNNISSLLRILKEGIGC